MHYNEENISCLRGKTLSSIVVNDDNDEITFTTTENVKYKMFHEQDCCEWVTIDDICGDLQDLLWSEILVAEEVSSNENPINVVIPEDSQDSFTWTFYKLDTIKGGVTIRWYGSSNGYYSESVAFEKIGDEQ
jgi:hypothetical protein